MSVTVRITSLGAAPRAVVTERPPWWRVLLLRARASDWTAYAIHRIVRYHGKVGPLVRVESTWYRDLDDAPVPRAIARQLEDAREQAEATSALAARDHWRKNRGAHVQ